MRFSTRLLWLLPLLLRGSLPAAESSAPRPSPYLPPLPALVEFAAKEKAPLDRLEIAPEGTEPRSGDSISALVTLYEDAHYRQWLLRVVTVDLTAEERAAKPPRPMTLFINTGSKFTFAGARMALDLRLAGPVRDDAPPTAKLAEKRGRALVNQEFLGLGFDQAAKAGLRMAALRTNPAAKDFSINFSTKPLPPDGAAAARARAEALGFTVADERAMAAISPVLLAFFDVVQKTPGLSDVLAEILDKTSLAWSALTHGGKLDPGFNIDAPNISSIETEKWGPNLPPSFRFPFLLSLNQKPTLYCQLVVTTPRPPLRASAGVIGLIVTPHKNESKMLIIRLLAGRCAPASAAPATP